MRPPQVFHAAGLIDAAMLDVVYGAIHACLMLSFQRYIRHATQQADGLPYLVEHRNILNGNSQLCHMLIVLKSMSVNG